MPTMLDLLDFEERWGVTHPHKEEAIRVELGITPARYYQLLGRIIDTREAIEARPMLVHRLQRIRDQNRQQSTQTRDG